MEKLMKRNKKSFASRDQDDAPREGSRKWAKFNRAVDHVDELRLDGGCRLRAVVYSGPAERQISKGIYRGKMDVFKHVQKAERCLMGRPEILEDGNRRTLGAY